MSIVPESEDWQPAPEAQDLFHAFQERWYAGEEVDFELDAVKKRYRIDSIEAWKTA